MLLPPERWGLGVWGAPLREGELLELVWVTGRKASACHSYQTCRRREGTEKEREGSGKEGQRRVEERETRDEKD